METSGFDDHIFNEFPSESVNTLNPHAPKAIQHHPTSNSHYLEHQMQTIMIGNANGEINQHQRLPDVHHILRNSPSYKMYTDVKPYSPNGKIDSYISNGASSSSPGQKMEYATSTNGGQYSPNSKLIEYSSSHSIDQHGMIFQQPQPVENNQQNIINGNSNFKRKSDEHLNNLSGSPSSNGISPSDASTTSPNKKPIDKKKNDPNGVKKKKTR